jgi:putative FmdB family regulatory protein
MPDRGIPACFSLDIRKAYAILGYSINIKEKVVAMPLYEYLCNECGDEFEKMVRFSEADQSPACPACKSQDTSKKISRIASFAGSISGTSVSTGSSCGSSGGFS